MSDSIKIPLHILPPFEDRKLSLMFRPKVPPAAFYEEIPQWLLDRMAQEPLLHTPGFRHVRMEYWLGRVDHVDEGVGELCLRLHCRLTSHKEDFWLPTPQGDTPGPCDYAARISWWFLLPDGTHRHEERFYTHPVTVSDEDLARLKLLLREHDGDEE